MWPAFKFKTSAWGKKRNKKTRNDKVREKKLQQLLVPSHEPQKNVIEKKVRSEKNGVRVEQSQEN